MLFAALHELVLGGRYGPFAWLGKVSYSSYLVHFPLQLAVALLVEKNLLAASAMNSWMSLVAFYVVLIPLSWLTYSWFEAPAQRLIRRTWHSASNRQLPAGQPIE